MYRDPVCGMEVDTEQAEWWMEYNGQTYYFCSQACLEAFARDPERYLDRLVPDMPDDGE